MSKHDEETSKKIEDTLKKYDTTPSEDVLREFFQNNKQGNKLMRELRSIRGDPLRPEMSEEDVADAKNAQDKQKQYDEKKGAQEQKEKLAAKRQEEHS